MEKTVEVSWLRTLHIRPRERREKERLLLVLHGLGDSLEGFRFLPEALAIPGLHCLLANAPDSYFTGFSWFDIYGGPAEMKRGILRSRDLLLGTMDDLEAQGWRPEHVGVLGFSQGCLMALDLACRYPRRLGAVVGISGFVGLLEDYPEKLSPVARSQQILVTHGTLDPMLPVAQTESQLAALRGMGLSIEWKAYEKEHTVDPYRELPDIRAFLTRHLFRS